MPPSISQLSVQDVEALREKAKSSLYFFAKGILGFDWLTPHVHKPLCDLLQDPENTRLRVVLPRGWLKSTICSVSYPLWRAIRNPNVRILLVQNTHTNACKKLAAIRGLVQTNQLFRALFPELLPTDDCIWRTDALELNRSKKEPEATFEAAGSNTQVTSRHYDVIIEDDTVAPDKADLTAENLVPTKEDVERAIGWHRLVLPLLVDPTKSQNIIVGTRWFDRDLISWNQQNEPSFKGYERAVRETDGYPDEDGTIVYPERFDESVLAQLQAAMGPYLYSCLYMNKPVRSEDMIFDPQWYQWYETPSRDIVCYTTVDLAVDPEGAKRDSDYNVVITTGKDLTTGIVYVLEYYRARCSPGDVIDALFRQVRKYNPVKVGIESVAYQKSFCYWVQERMRDESKYFMVAPVTHGKSSKSVRIQGLQPLVANGRMLFHPNQKELIQEMTIFPFGAHDDIIDALSMQLPFWNVTRSVRERQIEAPPSPLSFSQAIKEIRGRVEGQGGILTTLLQERLPSRWHEN